MTLELSKFLENYTAPLEILVVEDEAAMTGLIRQALSPFNIDLEMAMTKEDAVRCLQKKAYDAVLLDLNLPDSSSALETLRAVTENFRSKTEEQHLAIMSGYISEDVEQWVAKMPCKGVVVMVPKPYSLHRNVVVEILNQLRLPWRYQVDVACHI